MCKSSLSSKEGCIVRSVGVYNYPSKSSYWRSLSTARRGDLYDLVYQLCEAVNLHVQLDEIYSSVRRKRTVGTYCTDSLIRSSLHRLQYRIALEIRISLSICRLPVHPPPPLIIHAKLLLYVLPNGSRSAYQLLLAQQPTSTAPIICLLARLRIEAVQR